MSRQSEKITCPSCCVQKLNSQFADLEEYILNRMRTELPSTCHYHNVEHTIDVMSSAIVIAMNEHVMDEEELLLLKTAALLHDFGHINQSVGHEEKGCNLAREILPHYAYSSAQIEKICSLIMVTKLPQNPTNLLESILCDADLDYLGRQDFLPIADSLFQEMYERGKVSDSNAWNKVQVQFISNHHYWTKFCQENREMLKQEHLSYLRKITHE